MKLSDITKQFGLIGATKERETVEEMIRTLIREKCAEQRALCEQVANNYLVPVTIMPIDALTDAPEPEID